MQGGPKSCEEAEIDCSNERDDEILSKRLKRFPEAVKVTKATMNVEVASVSAVGRFTSAAENEECVPRQRATDGT